eukprot:5860495-Pyramimonas_sp.AAC.1
MNAPRAEPGNPSVEPGNPSIDPGNPSVEPGNPSVEPGNPSVDFGRRLLLQRRTSCASLTIDTIQYTTVRRTGCDVRFAKRLQTYSGSA